jgi:hypothetical protein
MITGNDLFDMPGGVSVVTRQIKEAEFEIGNDMDCLVRSFIEEICMKNPADRLGAPGSDHDMR